MATHTNVPDEVLDNLHLEEGEPIAEATATLPECLEDIRKLLILRQESDKLGELKRPLDKEIEEIEGRVIEAMGLHGLDSTKLEGYTVSRTTTLYPKIREGCRAAVVDALQAMGLGDELVTVNHPKLKSRLTEWIKEQRLPSGFAEWIDVSEKFGLSVRKAR